MFLNYNDFLNNYTAVDNLKSILQSDNNDTIVINSGIDTYPSKGWITINGEHIFYGSKDNTTNTFSGLERTSGHQIHNSGDLVFQPFSADVINYFIEALNDKNELIDDLYITGIENSEGFRDIFDYIDNYNAVNFFSSPITSYLHASGNEIYINSGINLLPDRGWIVLAGEEIFYNKKDSSKLYDLYRPSGTEHVINSYVDQLILAKDWNILQKATKNITMDSYKFGTESATSYFFYNCPEVNSNFFEIIIYFDIPADTADFPNSGNIPILSLGNHDIYLYDVNSNTFGVEVTYNGTSVLSNTIQASTSGSHKIHFRHSDSGISISLDGGTEETDNNYTNISNVYIGKCEISGTDTYAANVKFYNIQGSINNGFATKTSNKIEKMENLSYLDGFLYQNNSSYQADYFVY